MLTDISLGLNLDFTSVSVSIGSVWSVFTSIGSVWIGDEMVLVLSFV